MTSLLSNLRATTGSAHEALDRKIDLRPPNLTRSRYVAFLRGSLMAVEPLEMETARLLGTSDEVERAARIRADLKALGEDPDATLPALDVALPRNDAAAMGTAYVLEGSTLGGMSMAKMIDAALDLKGQSLSYLMLRGGSTMERWRKFLAELDAWASGATPAAHLEACAAAQSAFDAYAKAFERAGAFS